MQAKNSFWKFVILFLVIMVVAAGGYFIWNRFFSETAKARRFMAEQMAIYRKAEKAYIEAMTADTYGGKTPQETLNMFVDALRKGDIELASKYFMLDENLSREKWVNLLAGIKNEGNLQRLANDIVNKAIAGNLSSQEEFGYVLYDSEGKIGLQIDLRFNRYSQVWKIESL